ncbi:MAG: L,D-transpeptidase [Minisyncoccia bacterium]
MRSLKILKWLILLIFLIITFVCANHSLSARSYYDYYILVDLKELRLILKNPNTYEIVETYPIAGPASINYLSPLPKIGEISRVVFNPTWHPTENIKANYLKKYKVILPDVIPPGHPLNAMGAAALYLEFNGRESIYRIHGTNAPSSIGKYASSGCIRMLNNDIEKLASEVLNKRVKVFIFYEKIPVE